MIKILNKVKKESIKGDYEVAYVSNDPIKIETDYGIQCNNLFTKVRIGSKPTSNAIGIECSFNSNNTKVKIPTNGLIACYPFDGNTKDYCGSYNGVVNGTEQYDTGIIGQAFKFDGNTYIQTNFVPKYPITFSFWFKNPNDGKFFGAINANDDGNDWNIKYDYINFGYYDVNIDFKPEKDKWYHYVLIIPSNNINDIKIYINNKKYNLIISEKNKNNKIYSNNNNYLIIGKDVFHNNYYKGLIDQIRIYNRSLTEEEIQTLYIGEQINTPISNNQTFGIWIYNDYLNVKQEILTNPEIIEPAFPITEKFDKYTVAYCSRSGTQDCKLIFKAKNLIPGKKYKLLFGVGAFASIDEYPNNSNVSNDYFEITINNQTYKYYRKRPADLILLNTNKKILTGTIISKVLNEQNTGYNNLTSIFENIPLEFIASNSDENIILHFVADENFNNERWAYIVGSMKIIEE